MVSYGVDSTRKTFDKDGKPLTIKLKCGKKNVPGVYTAGNFQLSMK